MALNLRSAAGASRSVDFTQPYTRDLTAQKGTELGTLTTSELPRRVRP